MSDLDRGVSPARKIARRANGACQDCGRTLPVRRVTFWMTGMPYRVCAECERPYRHTINWPVTVPA